ncbi:MAG TPA: hypothetical protein VGD83_38005, partial [Streptosporangiaceae bacterium]
MNLRCTRGLPGPGTVTLIAAVWPAASVPDIGATTTFFPRPPGSDTDQLTVPPDAVSVIDPLAGGARSSVGGLTLRVPAPGASLVLTLGLALALTLGLGLTPTPAPLAPGDGDTAIPPASWRPAPELPMTVGSGL